MTRRELECKVDEQAQQLSEVIPAYHQNMQTLVKMKKEKSAFQMLAEQGKEAVIRRDALLKSYEANEKKAGQRGEAQIAEKEQLLMAELKAKDDTVKSLLLRLNERDTSTEVQDRCEALQVEVSTLSQTNTVMKRQMERMESDLTTTAAAAAASGSSGYKVVHMVKNPSVDAARERRQKEKERLEQLEVENEDLRKRSGGGGEAGLGPTQVLVNNRLKELFRKNVEQFKYGVTLHLTFVAHTQHTYSNCAGQ